MIFIRFMHDRDHMEDEDGKRIPSRMHLKGWKLKKKNYWYPETVKLWTNPYGGDGAFIYSWPQIFNLIQMNGRAAVEFLLRRAAGLFNRRSDEVPRTEAAYNQMGKPKAESISSGGNLAVVLEERAESVRVLMLQAGQAPPDIAKVNYALTPWLVTKFTSVHPDGPAGLAGGLDVYFLNLCNQAGGLWVDRRRVEFFPPLGTVRTTSWSGVVIRSEPTTFSKRLGVKPFGSTFEVLEYAPRGSCVFGRIAEGWVALAYTIPGNTTQSPTVYPTTWRMKTTPPHAAVSDMPSPTGDVAQPIFPITVRILASTWRGLTLREEPNTNGKKIMTFLPLTSHVIYDLIRDGEDVWGKVGVDGYGYVGWIALRYQGQLFTTWAP